MQGVGFRAFAARVPPSLIWWAASATSTMGGSNWMSKGEDSIESLIRELRRSSCRPCHKD